MTYAEQLKHPMWQKKRLEIMQAANFECCDCGAGDESLNVHHMYYVKGRKPWEYENSAFKCVCESCHKKYKEIQDALKEALSGLNLLQHEMILGMVQGVDMMACSGKVILRNHDHAYGIAHVWQLNPVKLVDHFKNKEFGWEDIRNFKYPCGNEEDIF